MVKRIALRKGQNPVSKLAGDPANAQFRLHKLEVGEVSVVDQGANGYRYLIVKGLKKMDNDTTTQAPVSTQKDGMILSAAVQQALLDVLGPSFEALTSILDGVKGATIDDAVGDTIPEDLATQLADVCGSMGSIAPTANDAAAMETPDGGDAESQQVVTAEAPTGDVAVEAAAPTKPKVDQKVEQAAPAKPKVDQKVEQAAPAKPKVDQKVEQAAPAKPKVDQKVEQAAPTKPKVDQKVEQAAPPKVEQKKPGKVEQSLNKAMDFLAGVPVAKRQPFAQVQKEAQPTLTLEQAQALVQEGIRKALGQQPVNKGQSYGFSNAVPLSGYTDLYAHTEEDRAVFNSMDLTDEIE